MACATNADCGKCEGGKCFIGCKSGACETTMTGFGGITNIMPLGWAQEGCKDTPDCPQGLIVGPTPMAEAKSEFMQMMQTMLARTGEDAVEPIYMTQPHGVAGNGTFFGFSSHSYRLAHFDAWARQWCEAHNVPWIDLDRYFRTHCLNKDQRQCYRDSIHWSFGPGDETGCQYCTQNADCTSPSTCTTVTGCGQGNACSFQTPSFPTYDPQGSGVSLALELISKCLNQTDGARDGICSVGTCSSGVCSAPTAAAGLACSVNGDCNKCTQGAVGDGCSADTDCDLYHCEF